MFLVFRNIRRLYIIYTQRQSRLYRIHGYWKNGDKLEHGRVVCADELENTKFPTGYTDDDIFYYGLTKKKIKRAIKAGAISEYEWVVTSYNTLD